MKMDITITLYDRKQKESLGQTKKHRVSTQIESVHEGKHTVEKQRRASKYDRNKTMKKIPQLDGNCLADPDSMKLHPPLTQNYTEHMCNLHAEILSSRSHGKLTYSVTLKVESAIDRIRRLLHLPEAQSVLARPRVQQLFGDVL
ncbi:hypothetical protein Dimus_019723, partial [Dionaea muscipula]